MLAGFELGTSTISLFVSKTTGRLGVPSWQRSAACFGVADANRARLEPDLSEQPLGLDLTNRPPEAVPGRELVRLAPAQTGDLACRDCTSVGGVAARADAARPVPAAQRVDADPERRRGLGSRVGALPRHCLDTSRFALLSFARPPVWLGGLRA